MAEHIKNTSSFERSLLMRVAAAQVDKLSSDTAFCDRLRNPADCADLAALADVPCAKLSSFMTRRGTCIGVGDHIFIEVQLYKVHACAQLGMAFCLLAESWSKVAEVIPKRRRQNVGAKTIDF